MDNWQPYLRESHSFLIYIACSIGITGLGVELGMVSVGLAGTVRIGDFEGIFVAVVFGGGDQAAFVGDLFNIFAVPCEGHL